MLTLGVQQPHSRFCVRVPHWSHSPFRITRYRCVPTGSCLFLKGTGWELRFGLSEALSTPKPRSCWVPCAPWPCSHASLCSATKLAVLSAHSTMQGLSLQQTSFASAVACRVCCAGCRAQPRVIRFARPLGGLPKVSCRSGTCQLYSTAFYAWTHAQAMRGLLTGFLDQFIVDMRF